MVVAAGTGVRRAVHEHDRLPRHDLPHLREPVGQGDVRREGGQQRMVIAAGEHPAAAASATGAATTRHAVSIRSSTPEARATCPASCTSPSEMSIIAVAPPRAAANPLS